MGALFSASDLAEMQAFNAANLPDVAVVKRATVTRVAGGTYTKPDWGTATTVSSFACRGAPTTQPNERESAGSITEVREFQIVGPEGASIPHDSETQKHRVEWTPSGGAMLPLYYIGQSIRSYHMQTTFLCTTEGGQ